MSVPSCPQWTTPSTTPPAAASATFEDLDGRSPGLGDALRAGVSVVIDGLLVAHPEYEAVPDGAEVYFVPQTAGG